MIRYKRPEFDLKLSYRRVLVRSVGLSVLLHLGLFTLDPEIEIRPIERNREVIVVELEQVPETRQKIPPPLLQPQAAPAAPIDTIPRQPIDPPEVVTEFAMESEDDAVEFWMLEKQPNVLKRVLPEYPPSAQEASVEGRVYVRILLDQQGRVQRIGSITGPVIFHEAAATAARQWEFTPAIQNDQAVKVWVSLPFTFQLE